MPTNTRKRQLSVEEADECRRLKQSWEHFKARSHERGTPVTQEALADKLGWTQGNLGHYLNGRMALNLDALLKICAEINADPGEISPRLVSLVKAIWPSLDSSRGGSSIERWPFAVPFETYLALDAAQKRRLGEKVEDFIDGAQTSVKSDAA